MIELTAANSSIIEARAAEGYAVKLSYLIPTAYDDRYQRVLDPARARWRVSFRVSEWGSKIYAAEGPDINAAITKAAAKIPNAKR